MAEYVYVIKGLNKYNSQKKHILKDVWLSFLPGAKIGVIGHNGSGKSTLLKIMAGIEKEFDGEAWSAKNIKVGYLPQEPHLDPKKNVFENIMASLSEVTDLIKEFNEISNKFAEPMSDDEMNALIEKQGELQEKIDAVGGWDIEREAEIAMQKLNCPPKDADITKISGGEKRRVAICKLLLEKPDMLLLDEPTNHLDFETVEALSEALAECNTTLLFVSHNRTFVNTVATSIITVGNGRVKRYYHDYENYVYHLKETLHIKQVVQETKSLPEQEKKAERIAVRNELKEAKKILRATEEELMELERRKQQLMDWFEKHTGTFSRVKQDELADVTHALHMAEETWFDQQKQVDELENTVSLLQ